MVGPRDLAAAFDARMAYDEAATCSAFVNAIADFVREALLQMEVIDDLLDLAA